RLQPLQEALTGPLRPTLLLLLGSAGVLLLVSAVNLANMLLARAAAREREILVRRAIGAGSLRLVRQLLTESLVLASLGGALGVAGAVWGVQLWRSIWQDPSGLPAHAAVDWRVLLFALVATVATAILFGLAPAARVGRERFASIRGGAPVLRRGARLLVAGEIALALTLAVGGTLLVRSLLRLQAVDPGFDAGGVLSARISLPEATYQEPQQVIGFYRRLVDEVRAIPGVQAVAAAEAVPMTGGGGSFGFAIQGRPAPAVQEWPIASMNNATPEYFRTMGIPLLRGRSLEPRDDHKVTDVAVVNETMARRFWPNASPVGARITFEADMKHWIEIVGVVGDVRDRELGRAAEPQVYVAHAQWGSPAMTLVVRTAGDPLELLRPVQTAARKLDPDIPVAEARTMEQALETSLTSQKVRTAIFGAFATLALLLAAVGIYGIMAYLVTQREREIALRMALGASRSEVVSRVIGQSVRLAIPGLVLGVAGALASARVLAGFLYEVRPLDPATLGAVPLAVTLLVSAAALVPARRAARTEPMAVLRSE
ncbi:MAG TPA: FtsX-like permease family protein, partial [Gemmatimonadales bacterium]|nr:FtsX-like permease family protein [Gemmatimonadales bacterium]